MIAFVPGAGGVNAPAGVSMKRGQDPNPWTGPRTTSEDSSTEVTPGINEKQREPHIRGTEPGQIA